MALKFLNKKGWHTGSLRNIENVWKAEQKHDAEQKKLEELRKQIMEEREKSEFRLLQEQAGLIPKQERLDFLYDSGLAVGKGSDGFKALEALPKTETDTAPSSSKQQSSAPGALFEDKPQSANDTWRKLHSDPLLLIRQREQEALARIKNNPVQMANIRKSVEEKKKHKEKSGKKKEHEKHGRKSPKHNKYSSKSLNSGGDDDSEKEKRKKRSDHHNRKRIERYSSNARSDSETEEKRTRSYDKYSSSMGRSSEKEAASKGEEMRNKRHNHNDKKLEQYPSHDRSDSEAEEKRKRSHDKYSSSMGQSSEKEAASKGEERRNRRHNYDDKKLEQYPSHDRSDSEAEEKRKRSHDKYSSSMGRSSEKEAASKGKERRDRSHNHDDKKLEQYPSLGRSDSVTEEKSKRSYDKYSSSMLRSSEKESASKGEERINRNHSHDDKKLEPYPSHGRSDSLTEEKRKRSYDKYSSSIGRGSEKDSASNGEERRKRSHNHDDKKFEQYTPHRSDSEIEEKRNRSHEKSKHERHSTQIMEAAKADLERSQPKQRRPVTKLSEEEKAARLREMQMDAVLHEEQRWKRLKKASENDAQEASQASSLSGPNFLNAAQKSVYGAEKGGSSTIEESVRRRKYYSQGRSESNEGNAFRR